MQGTWKALHIYSPHENQLHPAGCLGAIAKVACPAFAGPMRRASGGGENRRTFRSSDQEREGRGEIKGM